MEKYQDIFDFMRNHKSSSDKNYWIGQFQSELEKVDCCQRTALHYAAYENDLELTQILIKHGAKVDAIDEFGMTPLHRAAYWNALDVVEFLIKSGANLKIVDKFNKTVLHSAVCGSAFETVRFLLTQKIDTTAVNHDGETPLEMALKQALVQKIPRPCGIPFFSLLDQTDCPRKRTSKFKRNFDKRGRRIKMIIDLLTIA